MSLQGSIHKKSDGIGYGAFIPTERAYYNVRTPTVSARARRRPSSETIREYRRHNVTAGIDTHRSDISFGRTTESIDGGIIGDSRAREATKSLTSGEVGGFMWPAERPPQGNIESIVASSLNSRSDGVGGGSKNTSVTSVRSAQKKLNKQAAQAQAQAQVVEELRKKRDSSATNKCVNPTRLGTSSNSSGSSTWRSDSTLSSASMSSSVSYDSSRLSSARLSCCSSNGDEITDSHRRKRRSMIPPATRSARSSEPGANNCSTKTGQIRSHRSTAGAQMETRLRPISLATPRANEGNSTTVPPASPATARLPQFKMLDPVFKRHHKYDMIAEDRAAHGGQVTGRFGPVDGSSVLAASLLTSELSTPWSHVLRGQKW